MCARLKPLISLTTLPFIPLSLSCFLLHSPGGIPEQRTAQTGFVFFLVEISISSLTGCSDENGFLNSASEAIWGQRRCHTLLQPRTIQGSVSDGLGEMDQEGQEQERNKKKTTLCWSQYLCDFYIINKDTFSLHLQVWAKPLGDDIRTPLLWTTSCVIHEKTPLVWWQLPPLPPPPRWRSALRHH